MIIISIVLIIFSARLFSHTRSVKLIAEIQIAWVYQKEFNLQGYGKKRDAPLSPSRYGMGDLYSIHNWFLTYKIGFW